MSNGDPDDEIPYRPAPPLPLEQQKRNWEAWYQAMELSHEMLLAGLRNRIGPDGDLKAAYREWSEKYHSLKWAHVSQQANVTQQAHVTQHASVTQQEKTE